MDLKITPHRLSGSVSIPSSKSMTHRAIICAALAEGTSRLTGIDYSKDIDATLSIMEAFGAAFRKDGSAVTMEGITAAKKTALIPSA